MKCAICLFVLLLAGAAPADSSTEPRVGIDTPLMAGVRPARVLAWVAELAPLEVASVMTEATASFRLYASDGEIDHAARENFERIAAGDAEPHELATRLEQLVVKAAYHFKVSRVVVVSAWRANAGRHGTGEAIDFKFDGVRAAQLAAYLRKLPRVGVGVYTHPRTQYVHLDVRDESYHWIDASPPGVTWRPARLYDPSGSKRDAAWTPDGDLP